MRLSSFWQQTMHSAHAAANRARRQIEGMLASLFDGDRLRRALRRRIPAMAEDPPRELADVDRLLDVACESAHG